MADPTPAAAALALIEAVAEYEAEQDVADLDVPKLRGLLFAADDCRPHLPAIRALLSPEADAELGAAVRRSGLIESVYEALDGELQHRTMAGEDGDIDLTDCCDAHRGIYGAWVELRDQPAVERFFDD